jgi:hypothetical protein
MSSFFIDNVTLHAYFDELLCILPRSTKTCICMFTSTSSQQNSLQELIQQGVNPWVSMICSPMLHLPNSLLCHAKMSWNSSIKGHSASICSWSRLTLGLIFVLISIHLFPPFSSSFFSSIWTGKRKDACLVGLFVNCFIIRFSSSWTYWIQFV